MRFKEGQLAEHTSIVYRQGYADGLQEGERRGWEAGKEAAAIYIQDKANEIHRDNAARMDGRLEGKPIMQNEAARLDSYAAAIRKLKKP